MAISQRDKTISHFHTDPKFIAQPLSSQILSVGQFVFLDTDGVYKPAISNATEQMANVIGYVWSLEADGFYLKMGYGPMEYRFPIPLTLEVPGNLGDEVYLSATVPGGMQTTAPTGYPLVVGYKTDYGMLYRACPTFCCIPPISGAPEVFPIGFFSVYQVFSYAYSCSGQAWDLSSVVNAYITGGVPAQFLNTPLVGNVSIISGNPNYITCTTGTPTVSSNGDVSFYYFGLTTDNAPCVRTIVEPIIVYGTLDELFVCNSGVTDAQCTFTGQNPSALLPNISATCCPSGS